MKRYMKSILCLAALVFCLAASAQDLKPVKDRLTKKYGYQDKSKNWVIQPAYDDAKRFDDAGCAQVKVDGRFGLIDTEGAWLLDAVYDNIGKFDKNGLCELMIKDGKTKYYGVADRAGNVLLPVEYRDIDIPKNGGCILASRVSEDPQLQGDPLWAVFDMQGGEVFPPQFLSAPSFNKGTLVARDALTGLTGVVDMEGKVLLPFEFLAVSHHNNGYSTLSRYFTNVSYTADLFRTESYNQPGAVIPYDPMEDRVRAAAWHCNGVGEPLHVNQVRWIQSKSGSRSATCREVPIDWRNDRFIRLEPFVTDEQDEYAMADPYSDRFYTLKAMLYERDGSLVGEVCDRGYLEAECSEGVIYNVHGQESWLILSDPNSPDLSSYSVSLSGYRSLNHENVCEGIGIRSRDLERLQDVRTFAKRCIEIIEGDDVGITSYNPPSIDLQHARRQRELMRSDLFHHAFHMGDVVSCNAYVRGEDVEVQLYQQLVCRMEDRFQDPYYSMNGDELIYWGPHNRRTVRLSLESTYDSNAMEDDLGGSGKHWCIVLSMYEEDGSWLRTLASAPYVDYLQDGVLVFKGLRIALLTSPGTHYRNDSYGWSSSSDLRGRVTRTVKLPKAQPLPHKLSALEEAYRQHHHRR